MKYYLSWINRLSNLFAVFSGAVLLAIGFMMVISIIGRNAFNMPIPGDYDITKQTLGVIIACFLPYCVLNGGNLNVDFFTSKASPKTQSRLDALGALCVGFIFVMLAWRTTIALPDVIESNEVAGTINLKTWWVYAGMIPPLWLGVLASFAMAVQLWQGQHIESEAELLLKQANQNPLHTNNPGVLSKKNGANLLNNPAGDQS
jgi:TRAP-type C4-dicarboxylate transport system permease small subunit